MKAGKFYIYKLLLLVVVLLSGITARANHLVGMDLFYTHVSGNTYKITLIAYGDCGSASSTAAFGALSTNSPEVHIFNGSTYVSSINLSIEPPSAGVEITPVCPAFLSLTQCTSLTNPTPGIKKFVYSANYTLPGPSAVWRFLFSGQLVGSTAGRALSITNIFTTPGTNTQLIDTLNNLIAPNSSPTLTNVPTPYFCLSAANNYNPGAVDADGDMLNFALVPGISGTTTTAPGGSVSYVAPYTGASPLAVSSMTFDAATGQIAFTPSALQRSLVVYNIREYRGGQFVGSCQREMTFLVQTCTTSPPSGALSAATAGTIATPTQFRICQGVGAYSMHIYPSAASLGTNIFVTTSGLPAGLTFTTTGNGTPTPDCLISWTTTSIAPGAYTFYVTYTDDNCPLAGKQTIAYTITVLPQPTVSATLASAASCHARAAVSVNLGGGGAPWTVKVSRAVAPFDTIQTFTAVAASFIDSLLPGSYNFTVVSPSSGCRSSASITLSPPLFPPPTVTISNPTYCSATDGWIKLSGLIPGTTDTVRYYRNGVLQPYLLMVVAADGSVTLIGLSAATYSGITVAYGRYCVTTPVGPITLVNPAFLMYTIEKTDPSYCGACDGKVKLWGLRPGMLDTITYFKSGVPQPQIVTIIGADSTVNITGLCPGYYHNFQARTAGVCVSNILGPVTISTPPFTARTTTHTNPAYCGICTGTLTIYGLRPAMLDTITYNKDGVPQPYVVRFIGPDSTATLTGLCAGIYSNIVVRTAGICATAPLGPDTLTVPPFTMSRLSFVNPDYCGICNGRITLHGLYPGQLDTITYTRGGVPQTHVATVAADSTITLTGLCAGVYDNFVARTGGVCVSNTLGPVTLTVPPFTIDRLTFTNPPYCGICTGTITIHGAYPGNLDTVSYTKDGVAQPPIVQLVGPDSNIYITGLCAGVYDNFIARTGGVCVSNTLGPVTLTVPPFTIDRLTFTNPPYCGICTGTITIHGAYPGNLDTVSYTKDGIPQPPVIQLVGADSNIYLTGLCAGVYDNFIARTGGVCVSNTLGPVTLTVPPFTIDRLTFTNPPYCGICTGTITIHGAHPGNLDTVSYTKDGIPQPPIIQLVGADSNIYLTGLCAGVYDNFVARTGGVCVSNMLGPVTLTVPPFLIDRLTFTNPPYCGICTGTITIHGAHPGNLDTLSFTKDGVPQTPIVQLVGPDSNIYLTGLCAGLYDNFVARTGGVCVSNTLGPANLTVPPFTMRAITYQNATKCGWCDGRIRLYGLYPGQTDTISFKRDGVPQTPVVATIGADSIVYINGLCDGTYSEFVARTGGVCVSNMLGPVTLVDPPIIPAFEYVMKQTCKADTVYYTNGSIPAADLTYTWTFGDGNTSTAANPVHIYDTPGDFNTTLIITNSRCVDSISKNIAVHNILKAGYTQMPDSFVCTGNDVIFTNTSLGVGLKYAWTFGDGNSSSTASPVHVFERTGVFPIKLVVYNDGPCRDTARSTMTVDSISAVRIDLTDSVLCSGRVVTFTGIYAQQGCTGIRWTFGDGTGMADMNPVVHPFTANGTMTVKFNADYRACPDTSASRTVWVFTNPNTALGNDTTICPGSNPITIGDRRYDGVPGVRWAWNTGEKTSTIKVGAAGSYWVRMIVDGCTSVDTLTVDKDCYLHVPNAFTPNGDGVNDYFLPRPLAGKGLTTFKLQIFNRWGQLLFETEKVEGSGWDGTFNGTAQPEGVYVYTLDATFLDGQVEKRQGNVTLMR